MIAKIYIAWAAVVMVAFVYTMASGIHFGFGSYGAVPWGSRGHSVFYHK